MTGNQSGQSPRLLDQMRAVLRRHHYALRTERTYCDWVRRFVKFHEMKSRADLADGTRKIEDFLTDLAVTGQVAPSTQNQALNALIFLYERVLEQPLEGRIDAVRARRAPRVPEVLTPEEARAQPAGRGESGLEGEDGGGRKWHPRRLKVGRMKRSAGFQPASDGLATLSDREPVFNQS